MSLGTRAANVFGRFRQEMDRLTQGQQQKVLEMVFRWYPIDHAAATRRMSKSVLEAMTLSALCRRAAEELGKIAEESDPEVRRVRVRQLRAQIETTMDVVKEGAREQTST